MKLLLSMLVFILSAVTLDAQATQNSTSDTKCLVKATHLAMDQRDDQRMKCLKKQASHLSVDQCLKISTQMEYSTNAEDARFLCLYDLSKKVSFKSCSKIAKSMEYADTGDQVRWDCLRNFADKVSKSQCTEVAKSMSYPANLDRAIIFCEQELR